MGQNVPKKMYETLNELWINNGMPGEQTITLQTPLARIALPMSVDDCRQIMLWSMGCKYYAHFLLSLNGAIKTRAQELGTSTDRRTTKDSL